MVEKSKNKEKALTSFVVLVFLFFLVNHLWPKNKIIEAKLDAGRWPLSPKKHMQMSRVYFDAGNEIKAKEELTKAKSLAPYFSWLDFNQTTARQLDQTQKLIEQPEELRKQISFWEEIIQENPYYRDVLLRLSLLSYQLVDDQKAQEYWQRAFYLDPNNDLVQKVGKIINQ